jgi:hypothetical protein
MAGTGWSVVTGYDGFGDTLMGWYENRYGREWEPASAAPDGLLENGMFFRTDWHRHVDSAVIVKGKGARRVSFRELFKYFISLPETRESNGIVSGPAAYEACVRVLEDDGFYASAGAEQLHGMYNRIHGFIGQLAEARCFVSFTFTREFLHEISDERAVGRCHAAGRALMDTHEACWEAWAAMGGDWQCLPELHAEGFRSREAREKTAKLIYRMKNNDEIALGELKACVDLL